MQKKSILSKNTENMTITAAEYSYKKLTNDLQKSRALLQDSALRKQMLAKHELEKLDKESLSYLATHSCVIIHHRSPGHDLSEKERDEIALFIVSNKTLLNNLYPMAKLFLFARIQKILLSQHNEAAIVNVLSDNLIETIKNSYNLPIVQNQLHFWLLTIAGDDSGNDFYALFENILAKAEQKITYLEVDDRTSIRQNDPQYAIQTEALAYALVNDERFFTGFPNNRFPNFPWGQLKTADRINLAKKYPRVAIELLTNEKIQTPELFTLEQCIAIASEHPDNLEITPLLRYFLAIQDELNSACQNRTILLKANTTCRSYERWLTLFEEAPFKSTIPRLSTLSLFALSNQNISAKQNPTRDCFDSLITFKGYKKCLLNFAKNTKDIDNVEFTYSDTPSTPRF
jgi:hypothetical protein